ncbi:MAG: GAF domain-containing protein [Anaerolineae bacterium]
MPPTPNSSFDNDLRQILHTLDLLSKQIRSGHIETDYALSQIENMTKKVKGFNERDEEQKTVGRFEALYEVSRILGTSLDLQTVLDQVMDAVIQLTGAERGFLMIHNDDGNLTIKAARNYDQQNLTSTELEYSRTVANLVLDTSKAVLTTNATEDPRFKGQQSVMSQSLRSIMAAPLMARGRVIGVAYVENRIVAGLFSKEDRETLEALAGQAAVAIDNALLFSETDEKLAKRIDELRMLRRIDLQLNQQLDPEAAIRYTLETAARLSKAREGHMGFIQESDPEVIIATHHFTAESDGAHATKEHPIQLQNVYPQVWQAVKDCKTITFDSGQYGLHTVMIVPILLNNKSVGVVILLRDDGDGFHAEDQDLVERIVTRAAINIENGRLFKAVQAADKAKTEFVGIVAHDLKAPMTSIQGYADLLLMQAENLNDKQQRFLERISNTVKRMEILVSDLADVTRIESGQFLMDELRVSTASVLQAVHDTIMPQIQERAHTYEEHIPDNLPDMFTDYYRLIQVLVNLLSNAYKYTPNGGLIRLEVTQVAERIQFSISDNGIGLSEEQIEQLGTPFWRAEDEFTHSQPGTGLGFFITQSLVKQMGSDIEIESKVGVGSTFAFSVAIAPDDAPASPLTE